MSHPDEMSKLSKLKAQITEVKGIMMDNIEKVKLYYLSSLTSFFFPLVSVKLILGWKDGITSGIGTFFFEIR